MANPTPDLSSILAALAAQGATTAPSQGPPPPPGTSNYPPPGQSHYPPPTQYQQPPPPGYSYPGPPPPGAPIDLGAIRSNPAANVSQAITDAIAQAKAFAAESGITPYDRASAYPPGSSRDDDRQYRRDRSRSPPRRDAFRDNFSSNPYRDERRGGDRADHGNGHRDFRRDRSFSPGGPGGPRGRQFSPRDGRDRSPLRGGRDDNNEVMHIESSLVGLIIGRQGENLRRIETDTRCRVQFITAASPTDEVRMCRITGPPARRAEARAAINRIIEDSGMGAIARAGLEKGGRNMQGSNPPPPMKEGEETLKIMVPDRTVGLIIGRGGETIRDLQERSGCHINIVGENKSVNGLRPVNLIGTHEAAKHAKELIMEIVDSDSRNTSNQPPANQSGGNRNRHDFGGGGGGGGVGGGVGGGGGADKINDSIYVPSEAVGMIIGKGGETIREMQNQTGCKINVSQSSGPGEVEREIGLVGSRDAIERAKQAIDEKVEAVRQKNGGGGGGGGGRGHGGGRGQHRDFDNASYGQSSASNNNSSAQGMPPAMQGAGAEGGDPYAAYGGYQAYLALWYQAMAAQQGQPDGGKPPGTA
ncbi:hypothetical protein GQ53DRAFT_375949 [Thozetella sp. PMI_491]|nr:hypothetical protein GQ53DRAFT_375949 [Thozetella sp. PMI_491]